VQTFKVDQLVVKIRKRLESNDSDMTVNVERLNETVESLHLETPVDPFQEESSRPHHESLRQGESMGRS
jgi:hypothetical protein